MRSLAAVRRALPHVGPGVVARLVRKIPSAHLECLAGGTVGTLMVADWLTHLSVLSDAQILDLLAHVRRDLFEYMAFLEHAFETRGPGELPVASVSLLDCRYGLFTPARGDGLIDLETGEAVAALPTPAVTQITCWLAPLYLRVAGRLGWKGGTDAGRGDGGRVDGGGPAGPAGGPADVRDDAPGVGP